MWDITLTLKWKGTVVPGGTEFSGSADVAEIYNDEDGPYQVTAKAEKDSSEVTPLRELLRKGLSSVLKPSIDKVLVLAKGIKFHPSVLMTIRANQCSISS